MNTAFRRNASPSAKTISSASESMTLNDIYLLSQIVAVAALLVSLVFVGLQVRQQTIAVKAQTEQAIAANWMAIGQMISDNAEAFTAGLLSRDPAFADLSDADRMRYLSAIFALFKHYENMFLQFHKKRIDADEWAPWSHHIHVYFHQPGVQNWWAIRKQAFTPAFRTFLDASVAPAEPSPTQLHAVSIATAGSDAP